MSSRLQTAERVLGIAPAPLLTHVLLRAGLVGGRLPSPQLRDGGFELRLPTKPDWRVTVHPEGDGSRVVLEALAPPWPFGLGWARRALDRLLGPDVA